MRNLIGLTPVGQQVRLIIERNHAQEAVSVEVVPLTEQKPKLRGAWLNVGGVYQHKDKPTSKQWPAPFPKSIPIIERSLNRLSRSTFSS